MFHNRTVFGGGWKFNLKCLVSYLLIVVVLDYLDTNKGYAFYDTNGSHRWIANADGWLEKEEAIITSNEYGWVEFRTKDGKKYGGTALPVRWTYYNILNFMSSLCFALEPLITLPYLDSKRDVELDWISNLLLGDVARGRITVLLSQTLTFIFTCVFGFFKMVVGGLFHGTPT